jgi:hypothetical protein
MIGYGGEILVLSVSIYSWPHYEPVSVGLSPECDSEMFPSAMR